MRLFQLVAALSLLLVSPVLAQNATPAAKPPSPSVAPATAAPGVTTPPVAQATTLSSALIDINTAARDQLDALPQIGTARADAIIKGRPYKSKNELLDRKILPQSAYDAIKNKIVARQKS